jgi:hypothetical protein
MNAYVEMMLLVALWCGQPGNGVSAGQVDRCRLHMINCCNPTSNFNVSNLDSCFKAQKLEGQ